MFAENLDLFLDVTNGFAKEVTINGNGVTGIFDAPFSQVNFVESSDPVFHAKTTDVENVVHGNLLIDGSSQYQIIEIEEDSTGMTLLQLRKKI